MRSVLLPVTTYIREDQLQKEFLENLHKRIIDEKFSYIGERQANAWIARCNSPDYTYFKDSKALLESSIEELLADHEGDVNLIVLGPGNALKEKIVVDHFLKKYRVHLFFVDLSREILEVAIANVADSGVLKEVFIADIENFTDIEDISQYIKSQYHPVNFFTFLGNTFGNYPQAEMLKTIRKALTPGDKILIDVKTKPEGSIKRSISQFNEAIRAYNSPDTRENAFALLSRAGIEATDGTIRVEFSEDAFFPQIGVIKQFFIFNRSRVVNYCGEDIYFAKGERILVGYSNKYTLASLEHRNIFTSHGLRVIRHAKDEGEKCCQILCELA